MGLIAFALFAITAHGQQVLKPVKYRDVDWSDFGQSKNLLSADFARQSKNLQTSDSAQLAPIEPQPPDSKQRRSGKPPAISPAHLRATDAESDSTLAALATASSINPAHLRATVAEREPTSATLTSPPANDSAQGADQPQVLRRVITYEMPNLFASPAEGQEGSTYCKMRFPNDQSVMQNAFIQVTLTPRQEVVQIDFRIHKVDGRLVDIPARYLERYEQTWRDSSGRVSGYRWAMPLVQPGDTVEFAYRIRGVQMPSMVSFGHPEWSIEQSEFRLIYLTKFDVVWSARGNPIQQHQFEEFYKNHVFFACNQVPAGALGYAHAHVELGEVPRWITGVWPRSWSSFYYQVDAFQNEYNKKYYKRYERHWQRWWRKMGARDDASRLLAFHQYFSDSIRSVPQVAAFNPDAVVEFQRLSDFDAWVLYDEMIRRLGFKANFVLARLPERGLMDSAMLSVQQFDVAFFEVMGEAGELFVLTPPQKGVSYPGTDLPRRLRGASGVAIPCYQPESIRMKTY